MTTREHHSRMSYKQCIVPILTAPTIDLDGDTVDLRGFDSVSIIANVGVSLDTLSGSVYVELEVEESADDSSWSDVADADLTNYVAGTNDGTFALINDPGEDDVVISTGYTGQKRYIRVVESVNGTHTNGIPISVTMTLGHPHQSLVNPSTD